MSATLPITFSITPDLLARVDAVARDDDRSRSNALRRILDAGLAVTEAKTRPAARQSK
jgi:metal-responsive CopG/Arc/MetJ family transcriptional regulator